MSDPTLTAAIATEATAHGLDDVGRRWMESLIAADAALPVPTAGAMVSAALRSDLGQALRQIDETLRDLGQAPLDDLTTSQRRVLTLLLTELHSRADGLLVALNSA